MNKPFGSDHPDLVAFNLFDPDAAFADRIKQVEGYVDELLWIGKRAMFDRDHARGTIKDLKAEVERLKAGGKDGPPSSCETWDRLVSERDAARADAERQAAEARRLAKVMSDLVGETRAAKEERDEAFKSLDAQTQESIRLSNVARKYDDDFRAMKAERDGLYERVRSNSRNLKAAEEARSWHVAKGEDYRAERDAARAEAESLTSKLEQTNKLKNEAMLSLGAAIEIIRRWGFPADDDGQGRTKAVKLIRNAVCDACEGSGLIAEGKTDGKA